MHAILIVNSPKSILKWIIGQYWCNIGQVASFFIAPPPQFKKDATCLKLHLRLIQKILTSKQKNKKIKGTLKIFYIFIRGGGRELAWYISVTSISLLISLINTYILPQKWEGGGGSMIIKFFICKHGKCKPPLPMLRAWILCLIRGIDPHVTFYKTYLSISLLMSWKNIRKMFKK